METVLESRPATRSRSSASAVADDKSSNHARPTVTDLLGENHYAQLARTHWLRGSKPAKVQPKVVKEELWDSLEKDGFAFGSLLILENLQALER